MKLERFAIATRNNGFSGKMYLDSPNMQSGAVVPPIGFCPMNVCSTTGLSLDLASHLEVQHDLSMSAENDPPKPQDEEDESRSGSDNLDGGSGEEHDPDQVHASKKRYHRHSTFQIQEMEAFFKEFPHPDEKQRLGLSKRLNLDIRQVKFWFQNRRTQMKAQHERMENTFLRRENERLRAENIAVREAIKNAFCPTCGGPTAVDVSMAEHQLRIENARMRGELERLYVVNGRHSIDRPVSPPVSVPYTPIIFTDISTPSNFGAFKGRYSHDIAPLASITDTVPARSSVLSDYEKDLIAELAMVAMDEFLQIVRMGEPLWLPSSGSGKEDLDLGEYLQQFPRGIGRRPTGYRSEATRASGTVIMNGSRIVESFFDVKRWMEMFSCIVARADMCDLISTGAPVTHHGALQLMSAELQILSPLVPAREMNFLRFCHFVQKNTWAVVDVSVNSLYGDSPSSANRVSRCPSGCLIQEMPNGYSKVIWVEHCEYENLPMHHLYMPLIDSGIAFGAQRWLATLQRQCERMASLMASGVLCIEPRGLLTPEGRCSMLELAQRMTTGFCNSVSASSVHNWMTLSGSNDENEVRIMARKDKLGDPSGMVLSAATSIWLPAAPQQLFEYLQNENHRKEWDVLTGGGPVQEVIHVANGRDPGNSVSLLQTFQGGANMLILQESSTDLCGSLIVYAPIDIQSMNAVMRGGDQSLVTILPSGFAILPAGLECKPHALDEKGASSANPGVGGSLLTVAFQILVNSMSGPRLTLESINTVNSLVSNTVKHIKQALLCEDKLTEL